MQSVSKTLSGHAMPSQQVNNPLQPQPQETVRKTTVTNLTPATECPACAKEWTQEEIEYQACDKCGYPLHLEQNEFNDKVFDFSIL